MHKKSSHQKVFLQPITLSFIFVISTQVLASSIPTVPLYTAEAKKLVTEAHSNAGAGPNLANKLLFEVKDKKIKGVVLKVYRVFADQIEPSIKSSSMPLNQMVSLRVDLINSTSKKLFLKSFDARMPTHNHGMMTKPVVTKVSSGHSVKGQSYNVSGLNLHMRGRWVLYFTLAAEGSTKGSVLSYSLVVL